MKITKKVLYVNVGMRYNYKPFSLPNAIKEVAEKLSDKYLIDFKFCPSHSQNGILYHKVWLDILEQDSNGYRTFKSELKKLGYNCKLY